MQQWRYNTFCRCYKIIYFATQKLDDILNNLDIIILGPVCNLGVAAYTLDRTTAIFPTNVRKDNCQPGETCAMYRWTNTNAAGFMGEIPKQLLALKQTISSQNKCARGGLVSCYLVYYKSCKQEQKYLFSTQH